MGEDLSRMGFRNDPKELLVNEPDQFIPYTLVTRTIYSKAATGGPTKKSIVNSHWSTEFELVGCTVSVCLCVCLSVRQHGGKVCHSGDQVVPLYA